MLQTIILGALIVGGLYQFWKFLKDLPTPAHTAPTTYTLNKENEIRYKTITASVPSKLVVHNGTTPAISELEILARRAAQIRLSQDQVPDSLIAKIDGPYNRASVKKYLIHALEKIAVHEQKLIARVNSELSNRGPFYVSPCPYEDNIVVVINRALLRLIGKEFGIGCAFRVGEPPQPLNHYNYGKRYVGVGFTAVILTIDEDVQKMTAAINIDRKKISSGYFPIQFYYKKGIDEYVLNDLNLDVFFPCPAPATNYKESTTLFKMNAIQKKAIFKAISTEPSTSSNITPHLIRGPPGTGKTTALVELIYQVVMSRINPRIIVCTPSNRAADNVIERIPTAYVKALRLLSMGEELKSSSKKRVSGIHYSKECSPKDMYDVIVCTIGMLKTFYSKCGSPTDIPTHLIIDEASMVADTDMILVLGLLKSDTKFIMFGDDKQLGPVVTVDDLRKSFLETSMFERLLKDKGHERASVCLLENYRSCPGVVAPFNHLFYKRKLIAKVTPDIYPEIFQQLHLIHRVLMGPNSMESPTGVYFRSVKGDCVMGESKSWSNAKEANEIVKIFNSLMDNGVPAAEIGIITPYIDQVNLIKDRISYTSVGIGSVDSFQGQERNVILISTVRSFNSKGIGFVGDKKRLNVTLSRAKTALVIVGNDDVLRKNRLFQDLFKLRGIHFITS